MVLAAISWLDAVKLGAALVAPSLLVIRVGRKINATLTAILATTKRLPIVENDVSLLKADSIRKHEENRASLTTLDNKVDAISAQVANQKSTGEFIAETLGEPVKEIAAALRASRTPPPREGT